MANVVWRTTVAMATILRPNWFDSFLFLSPNFSGCCSVFALVRLGPMNTTALLSTETRSMISRRISGEPDRTRVGSG